jgi:predicted small lipoprotein YifL
MKLLRSLILMSALASVTACGSGNPAAPGVNPAEVSPRLDSDSTTTSRGNGTLGSGG